MNWKVLTFILAVATISFSHVIHRNEDLFSSSALEKLVHSPHNLGATKSRATTNEIEARFWIQNAESAIVNKLKILKELNTGTAKNIIMFLGDGMSLPTVAAARIYKGQKEGYSGEEQQLSFEKFPYMGLSKTYSVDYQTTDSAATATSYLSGVKTNFGTIGVSAAVPRGNCTAMLNEDYHTSPISEWAFNSGKRIGLVTTARVTHASPAPLYAHTANRDWESDIDVLSSNEDPSTCRDIAHQLIYNDMGRKLNVIFGGGKQKFLPDTTVDEYGNRGERRDGENLIDTWKNLKANSTDSYKYIYNRKGLLNLKNEDYVLGLFTSSHMNYELDRDTDAEPSLAEMTEAAIKLLSQGENGFFLFVEGARIDMAHHFLLIKKSLEDTVAFSEAIDVAATVTDEDETLIVVTSDHSHTLSFNGYPTRGNDILNVAGTAEDDLPYLTLSYANGNYTGRDENGVRYNVSEHADLGTKDYEHPGMVLTQLETHGGDDVGIFARGPWAHLFSGVNEQNVIPFIMAYASCVGNGVTVCSTSSSSAKST